jgi:hypothetical protein
MKPFRTCCDLQLLPPTGTLLDPTEEGVMFEQFSRGLGRRAYEV